MLPIELNIRKAVEEALLPKQVKGAARGAQIVPVRLAVAE